MVACSNQARGAIPLFLTVRHCPRALAILLRKQPFSIETKWSKASDTAIHTYSDAPSIDSLALVRGAHSLSHVSGVSNLDFSSRVRSPRIGDVVVWRNVNGLYAATRVLSIKDDSRGDERDELSFEYRILPSGNDDFGLT
jgi:hypothetical protein